MFLRPIICYFHKFHPFVTHPSGLVVDIQRFVGTVIVDLGFDFRPVGSTSVLGVDGTDRPARGGLAVMDVGLETVPPPLTHCIHILHFLQHFLNHSLQNTKISQDKQILSKQYSNFENPMWLKRRFSTPSTHIYPFLQSNTLTSSSIFEQGADLNFFGSFYFVTFCSIIRFGGSPWFREWSCSQTAAETPWGC